MKRKFWGIFNKKIRSGFEEWFRVAKGYAVIGKNKAYVGFFWGLGFECHGWVLGTDSDELLTGSRKFRESRK